MTHAPRQSICLCSWFMSCSPEKWSLLQAPLRSWSYWARSASQTKSQISPWAIHLMPSMPIPNHKSNSDALISGFPREQLQESALLGFADKSKHHHHGSVEFRLNPTGRPQGIYWLYSPFEGDVARKGLELRFLTFNLIDGAASILVSFYCTSIIPTSSKVKITLWPRPAEVSFLNERNHT